MSIEPPFRMRKRMDLLGRPTWAAALLLAIVSACGDGSDSNGEATVEGAVEGVSSEEMVGQATPMSLEEAESLGIVDTTVSVGPPVGPDSQELVTPLPPE